MTRSNLVLIALCFISSGVNLFQQDRLTASHVRENEMFVLANRLDQQAALWEAAAANYREAADNFERAALSCLGTVKQYRLFFDQTTSPLVQPLRPLELIEQKP